MGQLCTVGEDANLKRVFYYDVTDVLHIELIDRRNKDLKHVVVLVDEDDKPLKLPSGCRFVHVCSEYGSNLLDNHLRSVSRQAHAEG